ncbi:MAG: hypothetical protein RMI94_02445 [Bryobacterales bacterium]|nr:McrC family protein [Bryobacteraceae bacterium]MDW8129379.1 hypothetical protein [Bryobacterales bacterium]
MRSGRGSAGAAPPEFSLEATDHSILRRSLVELFGDRSLRGPDGAAMRLARQFLEQNRRHWELLEARAEIEFDDSAPVLRLTTGARTGAIPLLSPFTGRHDLGLIIQPRFEWSGIGTVLAETGWRVTPQPLPLPVLKRSARRVPRWVLAVMVLARLETLLRALARRFQMIEETRRAPRGAVRWETYLRRHLPKARFLEVPCTFPDLRDDRELRGAIRYCIELQIRSLETQWEHGPLVHRLAEWAERLLLAVRDVAPRRPSPLMLDAWLRLPIRTPALREGIQAIEWTVEERGLAGTSDLEGIPWFLAMDQFFEAWVETVLTKVAHRTGATLKTGRLRQTLTPLEWDPPGSGTQTALVPDHWLHWPWGSLVADAKYKRHWEEFEWREREDGSETLREEHRRDLLQVLAYAGLERGEQVVACLVYPCSLSTWESCRARGRLFLRASLPVFGRAVWVWLTAVPMAANLERIVEAWVEQIRRSRAA